MARWHHPDDTTCNLSNYVDHVHDDVSCTDDNCTRKHVVVHTDDELDNIVNAAYNDGYNDGYRGGYVAAANDAAAGYVASVDGEASATANDQHDHGG